MSIEIQLPPIPEEVKKMFGAIRKKRWDSYTQEERERVKENIKKGRKRQIKGKKRK